MKGKVKEIFKVILFLIVPTGIALMLGTRYWQATSSWHIALRIIASSAITIVWLGVVIGIFLLIYFVFDQLIRKK